MRKQESAAGLENETKDTENRKEEIKRSWLADDVVVYAENPKALQKSSRTNKWVQQKQNKIPIPGHLFRCTSNEHVDSEVKIKKKCLQSKKMK